ncbi:amidohydrolase [Thalassoroseus pseudoceratinae]|uniref:amidohydrolase n=1 Tax=Thalassoroseus pseudoceratinae TaxID=2713176 RepID=UPI001420B574|nr:amidohydrolase [Thalassoroseus pseudoceratinae]
MADDGTSSQSVFDGRVVDRCEQIMAHLWMVRTFVKHSDEVEDFPELMMTARTIFDTALALETRIEDPAKYQHMLRKKIGKLRAAAEQFKIDAPQASLHTNFKMAVISFDAGVGELEAILAQASA